MSQMRRSFKMEPVVGTNTNEGTTYGETTLLSEASESGTTYRQRGGKRNAHHRMNESMDLVGISHSKLLGMKSKQPSRTFLMKTTLA